MKPPDDLIIWATICSASGGQPREPSARQRQKLPDGDSRRRSGGARTRCRAPQTSPCTACRRSPGRCPSTATRESGRLISFLLQVAKNRRRTDLAVVTLQDRVLGRHVQRQLILNRHLNEDCAKSMMLQSPTPAKEASPSSRRFPLFQIPLQHSKPYRHLCLAFLRRVAKSGALL